MSRTTSRKWTFAIGAGRTIALCAAFLVAFLLFALLSDSMSLQTRILLERVGPWLGIALWASGAFWVAGPADRGDDESLQVWQWLGRLLGSAVSLGLALLGIALLISFFGLAFAGIWG